MVSTSSTPEEVDNIICGGSPTKKELTVGGAAGSVIAGALAKADPSLKILIIEAGIAIRLSLLPLCTLRI